MVWIIAVIVMGVNCFFIIYALVSSHCVFCCVIFTLSCSLQDINGPWYKHVLVTLGLVIYIALVAFFVSVLFR